MNHPSIKSLKVNDLIRILSIPGSGIANYKILPETIKVYKHLIKVGRSYRICRIDEYGQPWFDFRIKQKSGTWEFHTMCIMHGDNNWVKVIPRKTN